MINDLLRMGIIQIVIQIMFYFSNPLENPFWSPMFLQTILFMLIGVLAYWLIFRHIVALKPDREENVKDEVVGSESENVGLLEVAADSADSPVDTFTDTVPADDSDTQQQQ